MAASGLVQISMLLLLVVAVLCRVIDNKIYNPDEFEEIKKSSGTKKSTNLGSKPKHSHDNTNPLKENVETVMNSSIPDVEERFMFDAPCMDGFVKIGPTCIKTTKIRGRSF